MANLRMLQQQADLYNEQLGKYGQAAQQFSMAADVYNRQVKEYQAIVDAYYTNPAVVAYDNAAKKYNTDVTAYNQKANDWNTKQISIELPNRYTSRGSIGQVYADLIRLSNTPNKRQDIPGWARDRAASLMSEYHPGSVPTAPSAEGLPQRPGDFTAKKPEMSMEMPKDPGFTNQQMQLLSGKQTVAQQEMAGQQETGLVERAMTGKKQKPDSLIGGILQNVRYST